MLDLKFIRDNCEVVKQAVKDKNVKLDIDQLLVMDKKLQEVKYQLQELSTQKNALSKQIPQATPDQRPQLIQQGKEIGNQIEQLKPEVQILEDQVKDMLWLVPNIPSPQAPRGKDENDNVEVKKFGALPKFDFTPLDHVALLERNSWAEFEKIAAVSGSRSYSLRNEMVLLELALHRFALEKLRQKGFTLVSAPAFAREHALYGTGHFPTGKDQVYFLQEDNLYLSGTAEVQLNSLHSGDTLKEEDLPILYAGYSPCFRREAGSYGRDVRGLIRVHQFMKVEQYIICKNDAEESAKWHQQLLTTSEEIVQALELPYRIVECCTGDMGLGKVRMYDVECWVPSENKYRETHSCSSLSDWQARRSNLRYRDREGKMQYTHTLNNTAIATPRIMVSLLEVHQQADGSVKVPKALQPYLGGLTNLKGQ